MSSRWNKHVKKVAKERGISYMCAVSYASETYNPTKKKAPEKKQREVKKKAPAKKKAKPKRKLTPEQIEKRRLAKIKREVEYALVRRRQAQEDEWKRREIANRIYKGMSVGAPVYYNRAVLEKDYKKAKRRVKNITGENITDPGLLMITIYNDANNEIYPNMLSTNRLYASVWLIRGLEDYIKAFKIDTKYPYRGLWGKLSKKYYKLVKHYEYERALSLIPGFE